MIDSNDLEFFTWVRNLVILPIAVLIISMLKQHLKAKKQNKQYTTVGRSNDRTIEEIKGSLGRFERMVLKQGATVQEYIKAEQESKGNIVDSYLDKYADRHDKKLDKIYDKVEDVEKKVNGLDGRVLAIEINEKAREKYGKTS